MPENGSFRIVDVFAVRPMSGNQLAVVLVEGLPPYGDARAAARLQAIAAEFGFSETVFLDAVLGHEGTGAPPERRSAGPITTRIFTPAEELPFAGHPTLGAAWVVREHYRGAGALPDRVVLAEGVGPIETWFDSEDPNAVVWMRQRYPEFGPTLDPGEVASALSLERPALDERYPIRIVSTGIPFAIVPLRTVGAAARAREIPDRSRELYASAGLEPVPFFIFAPNRGSSPTGAAFHARMFASTLGIVEDPATGSANGCFAGYLVEYAYEGARRLDASVTQGVEMGRPSLLHLRAWREDGPIAVEVGGSVSPFASGRLDQEPI
jgi:trans-2,3-dihydro-3-hydroxyanthranilate isomerase